jgi:hypothetical protein
VMLARLSSSFEQRYEKCCLSVVVAGLPIAMN